MFEEKSDVWVIEEWCLGEQRVMFGSTTSDLWVNKEVLLMGKGDVLEKKVMCWEKR